MTRPLRKMIAQEVSDASNKMPMTICTGTLAWMMIFNIESCSPTDRLRAHRIEQELWQATRPEACRVHACNAYLGLDQRRGRVRGCCLAGVVDALREEE